MAAQLYYSPFIPAFSPNGLPVPGARLFFFYSGTDNLAPVYTNSSLAVRRSNPIIADLAARFDTVYLDDSVTYRIRLTDALGIQLGDDIDPYVPGQALKGPQGDPGLPDNTYSSLMLFKSSPVNKAVATLSGVGRYFWTLGDFTNQDDDIDVIKSTSIPLIQGAWVKEGKVLPNIITDGRDNTSLLQLAINLRDFRFDRSSYKISGFLNLPVGRSIFLTPGVVLTWSGVTPTQAMPSGFFRANGNNKIVVDGSRTAKAFFKSNTQMPFLHCVFGYGVSFVDCSGFDATNLSIAYFDTQQSLADYYDQVVTTAMVGTPILGGGTYSLAQVNTSRNIRILDCDGRMDTPSLAGVGGQFRYTENLEVRGGNHENYYAGVQCWGGDSGFGNYGPGHPLAGQPKPGNNPEAFRKCLNVTVADCSAKNVVAAYWGSMWQDVLGVNLQVDTAHDVGLDCEGGWNVLFKNCRVRDGYNGCFTTFNWNRNVKFENCAAQVTNKDYHLSRIFNESLQAANNRDVTFLSCSFTNLDPTGMSRVDTGQGPIRSYTMSNCVVTNAVIDILGCNQVSIDATMRLTIKAGTATNFVSVRETQGGGNFAAPLARVEVNIYSEIAQPAGSVGIYAIASDPNSTPDHLIVNGSIRVPLDNGDQAGIRLVSAGRGSFPVAFTVRGNLVEGVIAKTTTMGPAGLFDINNNFTARGGIPVVVG